VGAGTLALPDFMRGPGQAADVPATQQRLPVSYTPAAGSAVNALVFTVAFDPALLDISNAVAGAGLPGGSSVAFVREAAPGGGQQARVTVTLPSGSTLPTGAALRVVDLVAAVPTAAPYGRAQVLNLTLAQVNGAAPTAGSVVDDDALHTVGYWGDASGNAAYASDDVTLVQRVIVRNDAGFSFWRNIDPVQIADIAGGGTLNSLDASRLQQEVTFVNGTGTVDRPEIPPIPPRTTPIVFMPASAALGEGGTARVLAAAPAPAEAGVGVVAGAEAAGTATTAAPVIRLGAPAAAETAARAPEQASAPWLREYLTQAGQARAAALPPAIKLVLPTTPDIGRL
jgi:hypothetical protein